MKIKPYIKYIAALVWLLLISIILFLLLQYQYKSSTEPISKISTLSSYELLSNKFQLEKSTDKLFIFLHSGCVCSEASLDELMKIMTNLKEKPDLYFVFVFGCSLH